jgi:hypothetical protein
MLLRRRRETPTTLKDLLRQRVVVAKQHQDCGVRVNDEPAANCFIVPQRQIAVIGKDLVRIDHLHHPANRPVLDLRVRGRHIKLPVSCPRSAR